MRSVVCFFLILVACAYAEENGFLPALETKIHDKFSEYARYVAIWLQSFNDEHLGKSEIGRFLHYDEMRTTLKENKSHSEGRSKKMGMAMMPLVFHIGATSTWMLVTTILAAKSVAVGLLLLVMKIAGSSAKLASFFTHLKHSKQGHHDWTPQWLPHSDLHDHHVPWADKRVYKIDPRNPGPQKRLDDFLATTALVLDANRKNLDHQIDHQPDYYGTISHHTPEWTPYDIPHHFHEYKNNEFHDFKNNELHDFKNNEFHDFKNNELHGDFNFNTHDFNDYKTIPTHDLHGFSDGYHGDLNNFDGAKKKIDTNVG